MSTIDQAAPERPHPAKWSEPVLTAMAELARAEADRLGRPLDVLDPFAGVGLGRLGLALGGALRQLEGLELEPEWALSDPRCRVGSVLAPPWEPDSFDVLATSPTFGNRMADHHDARDDSERITYRHKLGRALSPGSSAGLQWGEEYRRFHRQAWAAVRAALRPGALALVDVKNHYRRDVEQLVAEFHLNDWLVAGCKLVEVRPVDVRGMRFGENYDARCEELVLAVRLPNPKGML